MGASALVLESKLAGLGKALAHLISHGIPVAAGFQGGSQTLLEGARLHVPGWLRRRTSCSAGQSLVELALILPLLVLLFLGALDAGRVFYYYTAVANATRAGGTYAINARLLPVGDDASRIELIKQAIVNELHAQVPDVTVGDVTVKILGPGTEIKAGVEARVSVGYTFDLIVPWDDLWGSSLSWVYDSIIRFL